MIGIPNTGNICFIINIIQILYNISDFREYITSKKLKINNKIYIDLVNKLKNLFIYLHKKDNNLHKYITEFCNSLTELESKDPIVSNFTNFKIHNDSSEFLIYIMNIFDDFSELNYVMEIENKQDKKYFKLIKKKNIINKLFLIHQAKQIKCINCNYLYPLNFENKICIWRLNISQTFINNLLDAIRYDSMTKNIDDYNCSKCKTISKIKERTILSKVNNILIIQLLRFNNNGTRINKDIIIPLKLNLDKFTYKLKNKNYKLHSICCHISNHHSSGHYISIIKCKNKWIICDDNNLINIDKNDVKAIINKNGYLLVYHKI